MVAQLAAAMAAGSSSGEEAAAGSGPVPQEIQEQAAPSMMEMMALLVEKVGGIQDVTVYTTSADDGPGGAFPGALPRWRRLARRVRVLHGNQPHFMRRLRASSVAARVHTQLPLPGSRSNAGQLNLPLQSADYHHIVAHTRCGRTLLHRELARCW